jgi:hypothetical protein
VLRDLLGRSNEKFVQLLDRHLQETVDALSLIRDAPTDDVEQLAKLVQQLEQRADERRDSLIRELSSALTTPIDREDLFRLSRSIDDVMDNLRDFVVELSLYEPPDTRAFDELLDAIEVGSHALGDAVRQLAGSSSDVFAAATKARHRASQVRHVYQQQMAALLHRPIDAGALRERELYRRLDVVGLRLGEAADALADGALKRIE